MSEKWSQSGNGERPPAYACVPRVLEIPGISPFVMNVPQGIADLDRRYDAHGPVPPPELVCRKRLGDAVGLEDAATDVLDPTVFVVAHEDSEGRITITLGMTGVHNGMMLIGGMEAKGCLEPDGTAADEDWQYLLAPEAAPIAVYTVGPDSGRGTAF